MVPKKSFAGLPAFSRLSIQRKLPFFICILLLCVIVTFTLISYLGIRNASLAIGRARLVTLTGQISTMFQQSTNTLGSTTKASASEDSVKNFLLTGSPVLKAGAKAVLDSIGKQDTLTKFSELLDSEKVTVLSSGSDNGKTAVNLDSVFAPPASQESSFVGKLFVVHDSVYYPVVAHVLAGKNTVGYLIRWRLMLANKKGIQQLAQLIGANGTLYIGNDDGKLWTDMIKLTPFPPINMSNIQKVAEYSRDEGDPLMASAQFVPGSRWIVLVELSKAAFLEAPGLFLQWIILIDVLLVAAGSLMAWIISRNITRPLKKLTIAASAIASGDYSGTVNISSEDEMGKLAEAFNIMTVEVRNAQRFLEKKVHDRTTELENANKELEAFSYSVSHDLQAPLRIINIYADKLLEKHSEALNDDGKRMLDSIQHRAKRMRKLIDELLNLSYLGRKQLAVELVDMNAMVRNVIKEQLMLGEKSIDIEVRNLEPAVCDSTLIVQVWSNLLSNAIKYSAKKPHAFIEIDSYELNGEKVYFVRDNGVGFDMKNADKLFGVFQRLHGLQEFEGSGIGLSLVQRVIEKHGGRVWAESEPDKGATFYFSLRDVPGYSAS